MMLSILGKKLNKITGIFLFIYHLLGPLKKQFWVCVFLFIFQAAWEIVIFTSLATFLQSLISKTNITDGQFSTDSFFGYVYSFFQQIPEEKRVLVGFILAAVSVCMKNLIKIGIMLYRTKFSTTFIWSVRTKVFANTLRNSMTFFDNRQKGALIRMVINETRSCYAVLKALLALLVNTFTATVYILFMIMLSFKLTLIVFIACCLLLWKIYYLSKTIKKYSSVVVEKTRKLTVITEEIIGGAKQVKLLDYHSHAKDDFSKACREADFTNRKTALITEFQTVLTNFMGLLTFSVLLFVNWQGAIMGMASFLTYMYICKNLVTCMSALNTNLGTLSTNLPAIERIMTAFDDLKKYAERSNDFTKDRLLEDRISFKNISLNYGKGDILKSVSLDIFEGQNVAIVGESGSGKTSLANLLARLYDISEGTLSIDGVNIKEYNLEFLRKGVGFVNQDSIIFNRTVRENILMASPEASFDEVIMAAKNAFAHEFINELPDGYDTIVGDRGVKLSGGQRQRITIAQIFLKDPELLILDEATSALDIKSEKYIQDALRKLGQNKTILTIAHRLATIKNADVVVVLDHGEIIESGSWDSLLAKRGVFHEMIKQQSFTA